jgi:hypothetical protein
MESQLDQVPEELKTGKRHVCWRYEGGTKVPKIAGSLRNASSTNPQMWRTLRECVAAMEERPGRYAGVGRVIAADERLVGVDLDHVRDPKTGALTQRAAKVVRLLDSYAEVSPSGTGVKLWIRAELSRAHKKPGVEIYPHGRYFTLTGWILSQALPTVEDRQAELDTLLREEFPEPEQKPRRPYTGPIGGRVDLPAFLDAAGVAILGEVADGTAERAYRVLCPWWGEHTSGDKTGTRVGQYADGALWFRCEHAHCAHRGWPELRALVGPSRFLKRRTVLRRVVPPKPGSGTAGKAVIDLG